MIPFTPLRKLPPPASYTSKDVLVLFGELFSRGYANGLIDEAKSSGMKIIGITVGRRQKDNSLRPLTAEELETAEANLGGKIINIPLWGGFDMESVAGNPSPLDLLQHIKTSNWEEAELDQSIIEAAKIQGTERFCSALRLVVEQLSQMIPQNSHVLFAHTMAGGLPRSKILLFLTSRMVKRKGDKYLSSEKFWVSPLGQMVKDNFDEVTANTYQYLIDNTKEFRERQQAAGASVRYVAYGYHGSEILIKDKYQWQTYNPYLPGWAKIKLEEISAQAWDRGIKSVVFNCPEIRTNSSDLFSGVELSLYPFMRSLLRESDSAWIKQQIEECRSRLKEEASVEAILEQIDNYHTNTLIQGFYADFIHWPRHNSKGLAELMLSTSDEVMNMNISKKQSVSDFLSGLVVESTGSMILHESWSPTGPVLWLGHALIAKDLSAKNRK